MPKRQDTLVKQLIATDGVAPGADSNGASPIEKHLKMAENPFRFLRGSAPLFYRDLAKNTILPTTLFHDIPLCMIQGDCHVSNFGFFTEEGSHSDTLIFGLNDFDDACVGHPAWDLLRFATSLYLTQTALTALSKMPNSADFELQYLPDASTTQHSVKKFLKAYLNTCAEQLDACSLYGNVITQVPKDHVLRRLWKKAKKRCAGGEHFLTKSALAKATCWQKDRVCFTADNPKFSPIDPAHKQDLIYHFEPFFDDAVLDVTERLDAGTGSVNMKRFYFLVGPAQGRFPKDLFQCHIVEVKKQRAAAPLHAFPTLSPVNRLNPAHLTQVCQRRMQRHADLILDETDWLNDHWLIRSRHHAKVGVDPTDLLAPANKRGEAGIVQYAKLCGKALALSHMRSDRRSNKFELAITQYLPKYLTAIDSAAQQYAIQTEEDWKILKVLIKRQTSKVSAAPNNT